MNASVRILLVEDEENDAELTRLAVRRGGLSCEVRRVDEEAPFIEALNEFAPQLIISDFGLPRFDGFEALAIARRLRPDVPFIFASGSIGPARAEKAMQQGASWYVEKGNYAALGMYVKNLFARSSPLP